MPRVMLNPALRVRTSQPKRIAPNLGKAHSAETRAKIKAARARQLQTPISDETRAKLSAAGRRRVASPTTRVALLAANLGKKRSSVTCAKIGAVHRGKKLSEAQIRALKEANLIRFPVGSRKKDLETARHLFSFESGIWRKAVFARDNFICQHCSGVGLFLHAHHIKPWAKFKELRFEINNGITLCVPCHRAEHKRMQQLEGIAV